MDAEAFYVRKNLRPLTQFVCWLPWLQYTVFFTNWQPGVEILKQDIPTQSAHFKVEYLAIALFFRETVIFPK